MTFIYIKVKITIPTIVPDWLKSRDHIEEYYNYVDHLRKTLYHPQVEELIIYDNLLIGNWVDKYNIYKNTDKCLL
jgi:hypothetical protein